MLLCVVSKDSGFSAKIKCKTTHIKKNIHAKSFTSLLKFKIFNIRFCNNLSKVSAVKIR